MTHADENNLLRAVVSDLRGALAPFAGYGAWVDAGEYMGEPDDTRLGFLLGDPSPTVGDCRRAALTLADSDDALDRVNLRP